MDLFWQGFSGTPKKATAYYLNDSFIIVDGDREGVDCGYRIVRVMFVNLDLDRNCDDLFCSQMIATY
jgi:hypothetical protein